LLACLYSYGICTGVESSKSKRELVIVAAAIGSVLIIALGILIFCLYRRKFAFKRNDKKGYIIKKSELLF